MTKNILNAAMVLVGAATVLTGCDFDQPEAPCFVQDSTAWAAKYDSVDEPKDESGAACTITAPTAETLGIYKFADPDDASKTLLTIRPAGLASRALRDNGPTTDQTAVGSFANEPDASDFCVAPAFSAAEVNAAAQGTTPPTDIKYEFTNVRVYAAPSAPGTQVTGELKYTRDGCTSNYVFRAIWPAIGCDPDEDPSSADNCGTGSGINPDFAVVCEPTAGFCVAAEDIPSFK